MLFRSDEEYDIFMEAAQAATEVELEEWQKAVLEAKEYAQNEQGVEFIDVDVQAFRDKVVSVQQDMLEENPNIVEMYEHIQQVNKKYE